MDEHKFKNPEPEEATEKEDSIAMELLRELKTQNERLSIQNQHLVRLVFAFPICIVIVFAIFIWYLYQYDFSSNVEQTGVYAYIDSDGNFITSDMSPEEIEKIWEVMNNSNAENKQKQDESKKQK